MIGKNLGHYRILEELGAGGMGVVYRAHDESLDREVAIKILPSSSFSDMDARARLLREARSAAGLNHPHICTIYEAGEANGQTFIAMELVHGQPLSTRILSSALPADDVLRFGLQLAEALEHAHEHGIVHRDLKCANVIVTPEGRAKVLDFGLAKRLREDEREEATRSQNSLTTPGTLTGTLAYMAPEQLRGQPADARSDIWAMGVMLYEMTSGARPFKGQTGFELSSAILNQQPAPLQAKVPTGLKAVIDRCMAKEPERRYQRAGEVRAALEAIQTGSIAPWTAWRYQMARRPWLALAALLIVLLAVLAVFDVSGLRTSWRGKGAVQKQMNLVVLPFRAIGTGTESQLYCDGLTETVTTKLAGLRALQVPPASEVRARGVNSVEQARTELGANFALEASWQSSGESVRINLSLVDVRTSKQLQTATLTAASRDLFALQDQVVENVVRILAVELQPQEAKELATHGTTILSAYDSYLRGSGYLLNYDKPENIESAIQMFQRAVKIDPNYGLAYASLGQAYWKKYEVGKEARWIQPAKQACEQALNFDTKSAAAHVCLGTVQTGTGEYEKAVAEFEHALETEPTSDEAYRRLADAYGRLRRPADAERTYLRAIELRPQYWAGYSWLGAFYIREARYAKAVEMFKQVVTLAPDSMRGHYNLGATYAVQGRYAEAIPVLKRSLAIRATAAAYTNLGNAYFYLRRYEEATQNYEAAVKSGEMDYLLWWNLGEGYYWTPGKRDLAARAYQQAISLAKEKLQVDPRDVYALSVVAFCYAMLGDQKSAHEYLEKALQLAPHDPDVSFKAALVYNQSGDTNRTLEWLEKARAEGYSATTVQDTPNFDGLRSNPRFQDLVRRMNLPP